MARVQLIDDDESQIEVRKLILEQAGHTVVNGEADAMYEQLGDVRRFIEAKQIRPILVFGRAPSATAAGVPASGELGLGNGLDQFRAIVVKAGTPAPVVTALAEAFERIGKSPEFKGFLDRQIAASDSFVAPGGARAFMERELAQMKQVVDRLPMHSQYLFADKDPQELPAQY